MKQLFRRLLARTRQRQAVDSLPSFQEITVAKAVIARSWMKGQITRDAYVKGMLYLDRAFNIQKEAQRVALQAVVITVKNDLRPVNPVKVQRRFLVDNLYF